MLHDGLMVVSDVEYMYIRVKAFSPENMKATAKRAKKLAEEWDVIIDRRHAAQFTESGDKAYIFRIKGHATITNYLRQQLPTYMMMLGALLVYYIVMGGLRLWNGQ